MDVIFLNYKISRKREPISSRQGPYEYVRTPTKVDRTSGLNILKDTMRPKAEPVYSETVRSYEVASSRNHGKTPMAATPFHYVSSIMFNLSIYHQPFQSYIPFGTITTPPPKSSSASKTTIISIPSISVIFPIPTPTFSQQTLNAYTTSITTLTRYPSL